jgi:hypothetical protein
MPITLRPIHGHYELIGETYLHGIMNGEAMTALQKGERHEKRFELH